MEKLERYLDQVCRSIGGPRSLRRHVRQELSEHLLDAAAQHRASGVSEEEALDLALAEFGSPEDMRSELEATHGHRMLATVIEKALQWKEMTMRAKWLWTTWATLAIVAVIALAVLFITGIELFIVPKFNKLVQDGLVDPAIIDAQNVSWMHSWLGSFSNTAQYTTWWVLLAAAAWGLFEWRVTSENKAFMRLAALGTVAVGLMAAVWLTAATLLISFCLTEPANGRLAWHFALDQTAKIEAAVASLDEAIAKSDREAAEKQVNRAAQAMHNLVGEPAAIPALRTRDQRDAPGELANSVEASRDALGEVQQALRAKDDKTLQAAIAKFRKSFQPLREAANSRPDR